MDVPAAQVEQVPEAADAAQEMGAAEAALAAAPQDPAAMTRMGQASLLLARQRIERGETGAQLLLQDAQAWLDRALQAGAALRPLASARARTAYLLGDHAAQEATALQSLALAAEVDTRRVQRMRAWLLSHPRFGPQLQLWFEHGVVPRRAKVLASVLMGAVCGPVEPHSLNALTDYGSAMGLAFQVVDDILDVTADSSTLGKTAGKDAAQDKPTFVSLMGLSSSQNYAQELLSQARASLRASGLKHTAPLQALADKLVNRIF
jgi:hypothetical protein